MPISDLNKAELQGQSKELTAKITAASSEAERNALQAKQDIVMAKIQAAA